MFYYLMKLIGTPVIYLLFFPKTIGGKNRKIKGRAIIVSNHKSNWDSLFVTVQFRRIIHWMGKIELFQNRFVKAFLTAGGVFPVRRGENDLPAIRHAFRLLREEKALGLFPEGTRSKGEMIRKLEPGTAMFALRNDTPVIPVYIKGDYRVFRRMKMIIGEQIRLSEHVGSKTDAKTVAAATELLENRLKELRDSNA